MRPFAWGGVLFLLSFSSALAEQALILKQNADVLRCRMPDEQYRFVGSNGPGQIFLPGEAVNIELDFAKGTKSGGADAAVEIQEITTRDPDRKIKDAFTDTAGNAPLIALEGKPVVHRFRVTFGDEPETRVPIDNLPVPERFGTYALVLVHGDRRQWLATVCRVPKPRADGNLENTPVFGEFAIFDRPEFYSTRAAMYQRMGVRGMRLETSWSERQDGTYDWNRLDQIFSAVESHGIQLMVTLGGHPSWTWPFGPHKQTPASVRPDWDGNPYWGQADWLCDPKDYPRYGKWITAFCQRYFKGGKGGLWGLENYNEPWEGGGISGWARDCLQYRALQKLIAESAWRVDRRIKICAASSIMNTEDKFYGDGSREFDKYVDVMTDHYVVPSACYGPLVAKAHGKQSVETETWFVNSEYLLPQIVQFLAAGQGRLSPWHPRVLFDELPGTEDRYFVPTPLVTATAAFNYFITGKQFEKIVFHDHLPWVFQFGSDQDPQSLLVVFGQLAPIAGKNPKEQLWAQVDSSPGGTMTIDNSDGLLKFFDLAGNPVYVGQRSVTVPLSIFPTYIKCDRGAAAAARIRLAKIEGKRPVEILPHDFETRLDGETAKLKVTLHNCLNRSITGTLQVQPPQEIRLALREAEFTLEAGERKTISLPVSNASPNETNAYPFTFAFRSDAGNADYAETLHAAIAPNGTKRIDGNLDDWRDVPGVTVVAGVQEADKSESLRRPWLKLKDEMPDGNFAEFKLAWDDTYLYVAARVNDKTAPPPSPPMAGRDENAYFHNATSDQRQPYKKFLADFPGRSFAEVPYVYRDNPERPRSSDLPQIHFRRDRLHIALDVGRAADSDVPAPLPAERNSKGEDRVRGGKLSSAARPTDDWHDLQPTTDTVPYGFHAVPDTDYEYALYLCQGGKSELWRLLAPGVPRRHDFPRSPRGERTTGPVPGGSHVVKLSGHEYVYEMAIPHTELAQLKLEPGTTFGLMLRAGNDQGPHVDFGTDKAVTKLNGLTLHPYWERSTNCGVRWTLVE